MTRINAASAPLQGQEASRGSAEPPSTDGLHGLWQTAIASARNPKTSSGQTCKNADADASQDALVTANLMVALIAPERNQAQSKDGFSIRTPSQNPRDDLIVHQKIAGIKGMAEEIRVDASHGRLARSDEIKTDLHAVASWLRGATIEARRDGRQGIASTKGTDKATPGDSIATTAADAQNSIQATLQAMDRCIPVRHR
jgi:hypothetical protein